MKKKCLTRRETVPKTWGEKKLQKKNSSVLGSLVEHRQKLVLLLMLSSQWRLGDGELRTRKNGRRRGEKGGKRGVGGPSKGLVMTEEGNQKYRASFN